jgi:putative serine protease PepD
VIAVVVLALIAGFGGGLLGSTLSQRGSSNSADSSLSQQTASRPASDTSAAPSGSVQSVADKVLPSVVSVVALGRSSEDEGSGVILTASGLILTNNHVIEDAQRLTVQFNDGTTGSADVVGTDPTDDLAVIKVDGVSGLTPAVLGTSANLQVGQQVVAIGSPLGLSATVTSGIVSALNRPVRTASADGSGQSTNDQDTVLNAIQTDAAINPGNSGGPLVDMNGYVIGVNAAIASLSSGSDQQSGSIGVGFAIPIDQAHRIAQEIINTGKASHAVLGATVRDATDQSQGITTGATIVSVTDDGGAAKAGLRAGDVVTKVGNTTIESADALVATIRSSPPDGKVQVTYTRSDKSSTVTVTLGSATN